MPWAEQELESRKPLPITDERKRVLDTAKEQAFPVVSHEVDAGDKMLRPVQFQPVLSPGIFEAEFGVKNKDLVLHFWPWGYRRAERSGAPKPAFPRSFRSRLFLCMAKAFLQERIDIKEHRDIGAFSVLAFGYGSNQFYRTLALDTITALHKSLGGD